MILVAPLAVLALAASVSDQPPPSCCTPSGRGAMLVAVSAPSAAPATNSTTGPVASPAADGSNTPNAVSLGMVWIPGGEFQMGSTDPLARPDEAPVHRVRVDGFWMDQTEVTNAQFAEFIAATNYKTVAERAVD